MILGIDCSGKTASCALMSGGRLMSEFYTNVGRTHSQTLMPMLKEMMTGTGISLKEIELIAVTNGPGSFTGLRIGLAAVKGLAQALSVPVVPVSTTEALAYNLAGVTGTVCPVMDARCSQVYTALFSSNGHTLTRLMPDEAIPIDVLRERLLGVTTPIWLAGDGAMLVLRSIPDMKLIPAPEHVLYQRAGVVCRIADMRRDEAIGAEHLNANYLRGAVR